MQANDAVASEPSIFSKNHDYKSFVHVAVNMYVPIFLDLNARGGRKLRTDTHTWDNYSNPRCAHAHRGLTSVARYFTAWVLLYGSKPISILSNIAKAPGSIQVKGLRMIPTVLTVIT